MNNQQSANNHDPHAQKWLVLILVATGTFMGTLDITIVNVALPTLTRVFDTSIAISQWYMLGYALAITVLLLPAGRASDIHGHRNVYTWGVLVFIVGSVLSGISFANVMLIVARAFQGVGTAMITAAGPALVTEAFEDSGRAKALGLVGIGTALGMLLGPLVGGVLVHYAGWRWIFFVNVPVGLVLGFLLWKRVQGFNEQGQGKVDVLGAILMGITLTALLLAMTYGHRVGWFSGPIIGLIVVAILCGVGFIIRELRSSDPVLHLRLFKNRIFAVQNAAAFANYAAMIPTAVFMPFYLQDVQHYNPDIVGYILASSPLTLAIVAPISGAYADKIGEWPLVFVGLIVTAMASFLMYGLTVTSGWFAVVWRIVLLSVGSGLLVSPNSSSILGAAGEEKLGEASAILALVRNSGMVFGIALAAAIISSVTPGLSLTKTLEHSGVHGQTGLLQGLQGAWISAAGISLLGAVVFLFGSGSEGIATIRRWYATAAGLIRHAEGK